MRPEIVVDLAAIRHNARTLAALVAPAALMTVVKADGYGHGIVESGRAARAGGATWLGVATVPEALELRDAGDTGRLLCWLTLPADAEDGSLARAIEADVDITAYTVERLDQVVAAGSGTQGPRVQLKVDTGLSRGGSTLDYWPALVARAVADIERRLLDGSRASERRLLDAFQAASAVRQRAVVAAGEDLVLSNQAALDLLSPTDVAMLRGLAADAPVARAGGSSTLDLVLDSGQHVRVVVTAVSGARRGALLQVEPRDGADHERHGGREPRRQRREAPADRRLGAGPAGGADRGDRGVLRQAGGDQRPGDPTDAGAAGEDDDRAAEAGQGVEVDLAGVLLLQDVPDRAAQMPLLVEHRHDHGHGGGRRNAGHRLTLPRTGDPGARRPSA